MLNPSPCPPTDLNSLTDARVVLLCGISGSGKTMLARRLEASGFIRISSDELAWARHGGDFTSLPWPAQQQLFADVRADIDSALARTIDSGRRAVVDATNCKRRRRDALRELCARRGITPRLIYLPATYPTLVQRLNSRRGTGPNDIIIDNSRLSDFCRGFEAPEADEHALTL